MNLGGHSSSQHGHQAPKWVRLSPHSACDSRTRLCPQAGGPQDTRPEGRGSGPGGGGEAKEGEPVAMVTVPGVQHGRPARTGPGPSARGSGWPRSGHPPHGAAGGAAAFPPHPTVWGPPGGSERPRRSGRRQEPPALPGGGAARESRVRQHPGLAPNPRQRTEDPSQPTPGQWFTQLPGVGLRGKDESSGGLRSAGGIRRAPWALALRTTPGAQGVPAGVRREQPGPCLGARTVPHAPDPTNAGPCALCTPPTPESGRIEPGISFVWRPSSPASFL